MNNGVKYVINYLLKTFQKNYNLFIPQLVRFTQGLTIPLILLVLISITLYTLAP